MKRIRVLLFVLIGIFISVVNSQAVAINYDFSSIFTHGQTVEGTTLDYATFTSEKGNLTYNSSYGGGLYTFPAADSDIYIDFSAPVNFVSVRAGDGVGDLDAFQFSLFDFDTNALIGSWATPQFGGPNEPEWFTLSISAPNIGSLSFDPGNSGILPGVMGNQFGVVITDFTYNVVPEPSTFLLLGGGLAGLAFYARRRRKE